MKATCVLCINRDDGFLKQTIESVLNQSYQNFEFIIVANNCSTEVFDTINIFKDPRIKTISSMLENIGYARNLGIDHAQGEYIIKIDGDDICEKNRFFEQIKFLDENPTINLAGTWAEVINEKNQKIGERKPKLPKNVEWLGVFTNPIINPSVIFRKQLWIKHKGYPGLASAEDLAFWLKLVSSGEKGIAIIPKFLIKYRLHGNQTFRKKLPYIEAASFHLRLFLLGKGFKYFIGCTLYTLKGLLRGRA
jgi:O86/O127-antigen biosynthesis beta-1,3-galactosyltransferase